MPTMAPKLRAIADRLIYDIACLKHAVTLLPRGALDEKVAGGDWNVRQVLAHVAAYAELYADLLERRARGEPMAAEELDMTSFHERTVDGGDATLPDLLARLSAARDRCIAAFEALDPAALAEPFRGATLLEVLERWSRHAGRHGLDVVSTFATLHTDPLLLRWTLAPEFAGPEWTGAPALQGEIRRSAREQLARRGQE